eukprot:SAG22_NODE_763_length_7406_cov_22.129054_6_plen_159_part_00
MRFHNNKGLGCGGWLLKVILEELEQPGSPYEHVILQASENSVAFYEHHGFVRVGAVTRYEDATQIAVAEQDAAEAAAAAAAAARAGASSEKAPTTFSRHCSPTRTCVAKENETPAMVAKRLGVLVSDVVFLNRTTFVSSSRKARRGTAFLPCFHCLSV